MFFKSITNVRFLIGCLACALMVSTFQRSVEAQVTAAVYNGTGDYAYDVQSMPDLDQVRNGLGNNGLQFCIPTSCMNLCGFAANFGFPNLWPGPGFWEGANDYEQMTFWIGFMGEYMSTDPFGGTGGTGKINGMNNWIADTGQSLSIVSAYPNDNYWPKIDDAAIHAINGAVVQFSYGRYNWQQINGQPFLTDRNGGHGVTLKLAAADNGQTLGARLIHYRNPATDEGNLFINSNYSSTFPDTAANIEIATSLYGDFASNEFDVTSLFNPPFFSPTDNRYRIMDSYMALYPGGGLVFSGVQVSSVFVNGGLGFAIDQQPSPFAPLAGESILTAIPFVESHSVLALVTADNKTELIQVPHNGRFRELTTLPVDTRCLALGFGHRVFAADSNSIIELRTVPGEDGEVVSTIGLPGKSEPIDAIAYDETGQRVIVAAGTQMFVVDPKSGDVSQGLLIRGVGNDPTPIRSMNIVGDSIFAALSNGTTAVAPVIRTPVSPVALPITPVLFGELKLANVVDALSVDVDDTGRMFVSDRVNGLLEYKQDGPAWVLDNNPLYDNIPLQGRIFIPFKNRANIVEGDLDPIQWRNIDPVELEELGQEIADD